MHERAFWPSKPILSTSTALLAALWVLAAIGAVGRILSQRQGWDWLVGLSSFVFILGLIWVLGRAKPMVDFVRFIAAFLS